MPGIDECLLDVMRLPGARGAAVVDWTSGLALGTIGESPNGDHEATAAETAEVARMAAEQPVFAQAAHTAGSAPAALRTPTRPDQDPTAPVGPAVEDVIVTTAVGYHILRFVETAFDSSVFLHLWLDRTEGNLALARIRIGEIAERLVLA
ncbi:MULTISPECIES: hypothetical protein [Streptomycetaceae]|uniref:hypothetical protein n=1 Tax=unclassified Streptomyces TaxID=2593676 RepID=UPI00337E6B75